MSSYLDFLKLLLSWGDKLPAALVIIQNIIDQFHQLAALFGVTTEISHNAIEPTAELLDAEGQVIALLNQGHAAGEHGAIGDGKIIELLRKSYAFFAAHPELLAMLLSLLK